MTFTRRQLLVIVSMEKCVLKENSKLKRIVNRGFQEIWRMTLQIIYSLLLVLGIV